MEKVQPEEQTKSQTNFRKVSASDSNLEDFQMFSIQHFNQELFFSMKSQNKLLWILFISHSLFHVVVVTLYVQSERFPP